MTDMLDAVAADKGRTASSSWRSSSGRKPRSRGDLIGPKGAAESAHQEGP